MKSTDYTVAFIFSTYCFLTATIQLSTAFTPACCRQDVSTAPCPNQTRAGSTAWKCGAHPPAHCTAHHQGKADKRFGGFHLILREQIRILQNHFQSSIRIHALSYQLLTPTKIILASQNSKSKLCIVTVFFCTF